MDNSLLIILRDFVSISCGLPFNYYQFFFAFLKIDKTFLKMTLNHFPFSMKHGHVNFFKIFLKILFFSTIFNQFETDNIFCFISVINYINPD